MVVSEMTSTSTCRGARLIGSTMPIRWRQRFLRSTSNKSGNMFFGKNRSFYSLDDNNEYDDEDDGTDTDDETQRRSNINQVKPIPDPGIFWKDRRSHTTPASRNSFTMIQRTERQEQKTMHQLLQEKPYRSDVRKYFEKNKMYDESILPVKTVSYVDGATESTTHDFGNALVTALESDECCFCVNEIGVEKTHGFDDCCSTTTTRDECSTKTSLKGTAADSETKYISDWKQRFIPWRRGPSRLRKTRTKGLHSSSSCASSETESCTSIPEHSESSDTRQASHTAADKKSGFRKVKIRKSLERVQSFETNKGGGRARAGTMRAIHDLKLALHLGKRPSTPPQNLMNEDKTGFVYKELRDDDDQITSVPVELNIVENADPEESVAKHNSDRRPSEKSIRIVSTNDKSGSQASIRYQPANFPSTPSAHLDLQSDGSQCPSQIAFATPQQAKSKTEKRTNTSPAVCTLKCTDNTVNSNVTQNQWRLPPPPPPPPAPSRIIAGEKQDSHSQHNSSLRGDAHSASSTIATDSSASSVSTPVNGPPTTLTMATMHTSETDVSTKYVCPTLEQMAVSILKTFPLIEVLVTNSS